MKIALCLSGENRWGIFCFPYIYNQFLQSKYNVDVFIHSWLDFEGCKTFELYNPKKIKLEKQSDVITIAEKELNGIQFGVKGKRENILKMLYGIQQSFNMVPEYYDIVIRCRFDMYIQENMNFEKVVDDIMNSEYDLCIPGPEKWNYWNGAGYNDQIAIGNYEAMKVYSSILSHLPELIELNNKILHPEEIFGIHLNRSYLKINQTHLDHRFARDVIPKITPTEEVKYIKL